MALLKSGHPWRSNYALPQNVRDEPLGRGTFNGQYIPRGTIDTTVPEQFMGLGSLGDNTLQGSSLKGHTLQGSSLAGTVLGDESMIQRVVDSATRTRDHRSQRAPGFAGDPVAAYGANAAAVFMRAAARVPRDHRTPLMREMLNHIDPTLWDRVSAKATELRKSKGYDARTALQKALAVCMASGFLHELDAYGKGKKTIKVRSHMGLAAYGVGDYQESLGGFPGNLFSAVGGALKTAAKATYSVGKTALKTVGSLACKASSVASNMPPVTPGTAGVAAGANAVKGICGGGGGGGGGGQQQYAPPPAPGIMDAKVGGIPVVPLAIGAAGLAAIYFMTRKKSA